MSEWGQTWDWLTDPANYHGMEGVPWRFKEHLAISAESVLIAAAIALPLGLVLGHFRRGSVFITSIANSARAIPVVGVLIILSLGPFGVGRGAVIVSLVIFAIPPIVTNAYTGVRTVDPDVREAAVGTGMRGWQVLMRVEAPLAIPLVAAGVRLASVQVWATATLAALVGSGGFGRFVVDGYSIQDYGEVYGGVIYIALTSVMLEFGLGMVEKRLRARYGASREVTGGVVPVARGGNVAAV